MRPLAIVTGASSGIGEKMAQSFAQRGYDLVVVARRAERLARLKHDLESACGVSVDVVAADLGEKGGADVVAAAVANRDVDVLVNNAGAGWIGLFAESPYERQLEIIDLNCRALVALTHRLLPGMVQRGRGHIMQVASVAGFLPGPRSSVYYASKAFVVSHSEALRHELRGTGVTITLVCPGPVATEFQVSSGVTSPMGGAVMMSDTDVAELGVEATLKGTFLCVPGPSNYALVLLAGLLPRRLGAALVDRIQRKRLSTTEGRSADT